MCMLAIRTRPASGRSCILHFTVMFSIALTSMSTASASASRVVSSSAAGDDLPLSGATMASRKR